MKFKKTILKNGVRVITAPMAGNPTVTVMINVATGSYYEKPEQSGLSHFLEHMCFKGTAKRPSARQIATELDSIGAAYNAFTGREVTGYWAKADMKHFAKIADIVSDIFENSTFPEKEIEKEKGVVMGEIDMYADDPQEKIAEALTKHMYKGQPAERDVLGTKETVKAITRNELLSYRGSQYTGPNVVVTVAGGVSEKDMLAWAKKTFSNIKNSKPKPEFATKTKNQKSPESVFLDKDTDQAHVILAWRTFDRNNPNRYVARIITNILRSGMSSRLFQRLRDEMGSGYYITAGHNSHSSFGHFSISTGTTHARVAEIISAVLEETDRLKKELVPADELGKVKESMRAHLLMSLETSDDVADYCADQEIFEEKILLPAEFDAIFSKITDKDIMRVSKIIFDRKKLTVAAIGKVIDKEAVKKAIL